MAGIVLLATATLAPSYAAFYYLVFVLPIAALLVRDPNGAPGAGIFDRIAVGGVRRRAVGVTLTLATALSIVNIAVPGRPFEADIYGQMGARGVIGHTLLVPTTVVYASLFWLLACAVILASYARRPADPSEGDDLQAQESGADAPAPAEATTTESAPAEAAGGGSKTPPTS